MHKLVGWETNLQGCKGVVSKELEKLLALRAPEKLWLTRDRRATRQKPFKRYVPQTSQPATSGGVESNYRYYRHLCSSQVKRSHNTCNVPQPRVRSVRSVGTLWVTPACRHVSLASA